MKKLFMVLALFLTWSLNAQDVEKIIDKHIEVSGGAPGWRSLTNVFMKGTVRLGMKEEYPIQIIQQRPDLRKTILTVGGKPIPIDGYDGKRGYGMNYATNKLEVYPSYVPEDFDSDLLIWKNVGFEAEYEGAGNVDGRKTHIISLTKNKNKTRYYIDMENFQLLKEEKPDETIIYQNFKKVGNLIFPYRIISESKKKDGDYVMDIKTIEVNKALPASTFKF